MRFIAILIVALFSVDCSAQCPNGNCPNVRSYRQVRQRQYYQPVVRQQYVQPVQQQYIQPAVPTVLVQPVSTTVPDSLVQPIQETHYVEQVIVQPVQRKVVYQRRENYNHGGPRWNYYGSNLAGHVENTHGIDITGMSRAAIEAAHSRAHNGLEGYR